MSPELALEYDVHVRQYRGEPRHGHQAAEFAIAPHAECHTLRVLVPVVPLLYEFRERLRCKIVSHSAPEVLNPVPYPRHCVRWERSEDTNPQTDTSMWIIAPIESARKEK